MVQCIAFYFYAAFLMVDLKRRFMLLLMHCLFMMIFEGSQRRKLQIDRVRGTVRYRK